MALKFISLPLFSDSVYTYTIALQNQAYRVQIQWNTRTERWYMSLYEDDDTAILLSIELVPDYPIAANYELFPLTGFFYLESKSERDVDRYFTSPRLIYDYYNLFYVFNE